MDYVSNRNGRSSSPRQQPTETSVPSQQPVAHLQQATVRTDHPKEKPHRRKKPFIILGALFALVAMALIGFMLFGASSPTSAAIDGSKYQAVFFTNGQVYFGKLKTFNGDYMKLSQVYYLQTKSGEADEKDAKVQSASKQDSSDVELIKLGNEIHGPEDEMVISRDQVLFFENLKPAGSVSQTITNYQKQGK